MYLRKILTKIRNEGLRGALKSVGRRLQGRIFTTGYDTDVVRPLLEELWEENGSVSLVEIGANIGATESDPLYNFIRQHYGSHLKSNDSESRAILIEPVKELYDQLVDNYANINGVICINAAIAEFSGVKRFYRFRSNIDIEALGLPPYAHQLGSFDLSNITSSFPSFPDEAAREAFLNANVLESEVPCSTLHEILDAEKIDHVDLLLIDAEGYDYQILKTINFSEFAPKYINYERTHLGKDQAACRRLLLKNGYSLLDHSDDTLCIKGKKLGILESLRERIYIYWLELIF